MQRTKARKLRRRYAVADPDERGRRVAEDLYALAGRTREIYWIGRAGDVRRFERYLHPGDRFERVGEIALPRPSRRRPPRGMGMMGLRRRVAGFFGPPPGTTLEAFRLAGPGHGRSAPDPAAPRGGGRTGGSSSR